MGSSTWRAAWVATGVLAVAGCGSTESTHEHASSSPSGGSSAVVSAGGVALEPGAGTGVSKGQRTSGSVAEGPSGPTTTAARALGATRPHAGAAPRIVHGNRVRRPARGTGGNTVNDDNPAGKASAADSGKLGPANPCLVSRTQAESFTGTSVAAPKVAPLGPTCVYLAKGGKMVTLAVEQTVFAKLKPHIHKLSSYTVRGSRAYCGIYGTPITYVLLPRERALVVSAPCDVGKRFATAALAKLSA